MNAVALSKAKATLAELRVLLPDHTATIDTLAEKLEAAGNCADASAASPNKEG